MTDEFCVIDDIVCCVNVTTWHLFAFWRWVGFNVVMSWIKPDWICWQRCSKIILAILPSVFEHDQSEGLGDGSNMLQPDDIREYCWSSNTSFQLPSQLNTEHPHGLKDHSSYLTSPFLDVPSQGSVRHPWILAMSGCTCHSLLSQEWNGGAASILKPLRCV